MGPGSPGLAAERRMSFPEAAVLPHLYDKYYLSLFPLDSLTPCKEWSG